MNEATSELIEIQEAFKQAADQAVLSTNEAYVIFE